MDFTIKPSIVYVQVDSRNVIMDINSDAFLSDPNGWIQLDEGYGDKYLHAQTQYFPGPVITDGGVGRYLYTPDAAVKWQERTQEEVDADRQPAARTLDERVTMLETKVDGEMTDMESALNLLGVYAE